MRKWPFFHRRWEPRSPWSRSRQLPGPTAGQPAPADWPEPAANWQYQHIWLLFLKIWATTGLNLKKYEANMVILPSCLGIYSGADFEVKLRWEPVFHLLTACLTCSWLDIMCSWVNMLGTWLAMFSSWHVPSLTWQSTSFTWMLPAWFDIFTS